MRSIKFRVWDTKKKKMFDAYELDLVNLYAKYWSYESRYGFPGNDNFPAKLMQYTGLKDINGVEIYEGDIVEIRGHAFEGSIKIDGFYEVGYNERMELCCGSWLLHREMHYVTVAGNMYENSNLLRFSASVSTE